MRLELHPDRVLRAQCARFLTTTLRAETGRRGPACEGGCHAPC